MEPVMVMGGMLKDLGVIDLLTEGEYYKTFNNMTNMSYEKRYVIKNEVPKIELILTLLKKGNFDKSELNMYLSKVRSMYERTNN